MTLVEKIFNCFKNSESFSLQEAYEQNLDKPQETVRARIYEKIAFVILELFSLQLSSVTQLYLTLCNPIDCSMPGFPVHPSPTPGACSNSCSSSQ